MTFTIIMATYNSASTIEIAVKSILSQTYNDFEILIIDGLSKDDTIKRVLNLVDERIKIISEKDNGVYDAMNKGIKLAKGDWLYFLGSDDKFCDNIVLDRVASFLSMTNNSVLYGNAVIIGNTNWANNGVIYDGIFNIKKLLSKNICHQAVFYKRDSIVKKKLFFNVEYPICADWDFNLKLWLIQPFEYIPLNIAFFRAGGISTDKNPKDEFLETIVLKMIEYSGIDSYQELKNIIPAEKLYQLNAIPKYKWLIKLSSLKLKLSTFWK